MYDDEKHDDFDLRECACCDAKIFIGDWPEHVKSYYHQIMFKYRLKKLAFCWAGNKQIVPHRVEECNTCQKRQKELRNNKDICLLDDMVVYNPAEDPEYQAYLERSKALSSPGTSDRYTCVPCEKYNLSKEFYDCHLKGKKHKYRMMEVRRKEKVERGKDGEKKGVKRKAEVEDKEEREKALTFGNFFKFLKRSSSTSAPEPESDESGGDAEESAVPVTVSKKKKKKKKKKKQC